MLINTNQPLITSFHKKVPIVCLISDESALIRNFLRNGRVRVESQVSYDFNLRSVKRVFYSKQISHPDSKNVQMNPDRF